MMPAGGENTTDLEWGGKPAPAGPGGGLPEMRARDSLRARDSVLGVLLDVVGRVERRRHLVR